MFARKLARKFTRPSFRAAAGLIVLALGSAAGAGCGTDEATPADPDAATAERAARGTRGERGEHGEHGEHGELDAVTTDPNAPLAVFLGDSLTAGYGLPGDSGFPAVIERTLREEGQPIRVVNAGVSGDTSAGGLSRLPWLLEQRPDVLVVGLGGNDGLRGLPPASTRENLRQIVRAAQAQDVAVLLLGLRLPPNYGPEYTGEFERVYAEVADELGVPLVPFMLEGVGGDPRLNQGDGIHPTAEGQRIVARNVLPQLRELLEAAR